MHIFYCASESFREVAGVFFSRKHSPDALRGGTGCWPLASGVLSGAAECTGRTGESPVLSVRCTAWSSGGGLAQVGDCSWPSPGDCERFVPTSAESQRQH